MCANIFPYNFENNQNNDEKYKNVDDFNYKKINNESSNNFIVKLYANIRKQNKKLRLNDTISLPINESEKLLQLNINNQSIVKLTFGKFVMFAKVTEYNSPQKTITLEKWMLEKLGAKENDFIKITIENIKHVTKIKITTSKEITNSLEILEYELLNRNIIYKNEKILISVFEKIYEFSIDEIYSEQEQIDCGTLHCNVPNKNGLTEIIFDLNLV